VRKCKTKACVLKGRRNGYGYCVPCFRKEAEKQEKEGDQEGEGHQLRQRKVTDYFPRQRVSSGTISITADVESRWTLTLPVEIWFIILTTYDNGPDIWDIGRLQFVNRDFYHLINSFELWRILWKRIVPLSWLDLLRLQLKANEGEEHGTVFTSNNDWPQQQYQ